MKEVLEYNGKNITIMKQPASFILNLERNTTKFNGVDLPAYVEEVLKYPSGENPGIEEFVIIPNVIEVEVNGEKLQLNTRNEADPHGINCANQLFKAFTDIGRTEPAFVGELFLQKVGKMVDTVSFNDLNKIGNEVMIKIQDIAVLPKIRDIFRRM